MAEPNYVLVTDAERAELFNLRAAVERVRALVGETRTVLSIGCLAESDESGVVDCGGECGGHRQTAWSLDPRAILGALDAQRPAEGGPEVTERLIEPSAAPCPHCGPGYRYGYEGCRHVPPTAEGGPEERTDDEEMPRVHELTVAPNTWVSFPGVPFAVAWHPTEDRWYATVKVFPHPPLPLEEVPIAAALDAGQPATEPVKDHPPCDCGHEFETDPSWFHLDQCAYRRSFEKPITEEQG
jgi:hypothetical protein